MNEESSSAPPQQRPSTAAAASRARARPTIRKPAISVLPHQTPRLRDHYLLGKKLGQGQFGITYLCTHKASSARYACKSISKRKLFCREDYEDVYREIQIMHHLSGQPNVLCAGGELFDRIVAKGHYSEKEAAKLIKNIIGVVEYCHSLGVIHRDLKPENFCLINLVMMPCSRLQILAFLSFTSQVVFSILVACSLEELWFDLFYFGQYFYDVVGSPYYVAPEVLLKHYGPQADVWSAGVILYILLSGVPPFWAETDSGIFRQILQGKLDLESDPWPNISESAKDLIGKMLDRDPRQRITAHEVLCNPWIVDDRVAPDRPLDSAVLSRLKHFSAMNKLKKMALRVIAERLSEEEIGGLKELFKMIDTDNSGTITFEELKHGLKRVGSQMTETEIKDLMDAADTDKSGTIDYGEFLAATLHLNKMEREDNLVAAFSYFDKDGSGYITIDELQQACRDFGLGDVHLDETIKEIDQDNDGRIDYGEFAAMMRKGDGGVGRTRTMRSNLNFNLADALGVENATSDAK
ncbi:calcium-dependent protein [Salix suchowensis]|nr:calcium-dependent protein [Salix suchowensis]